MTEDPAAPIPTTLCGHALIPAPDGSLTVILRREELPLRAAGLFAGATLLFMVSVALRPIRDEALLVLASAVGFCAVWLFHWLLRTHGAEEWHLSKGSLELRESFFGRWWVRRAAPHVFRLSAVGSSQRALFRLAVEAENSRRVLGSLCAGNPEQALELERLARLISERTGGALHVDRRAEELLYEFRASLHEHSASPPADPVDPERTLSQLAGADPAQYDRLLEPLADAGREPVPVLQRLLSDSNQALQFAAIRALGRTGDPFAVAPLRGLLHHDLVPVRRAVVRALGQIPGADSGLALLEALNDPDSGVVGEAVEAVGRVLGPAGAPALVELLDTSREFDIPVARALGAAANPAALPALERLLRTPDPAVQRAAAEAMGRIGHPSSGPALLQALDSLPGGGDEDRETVDALCTALERTADAPLARTLAGRLDATYRGIRLACVPGAAALRDPDSNLRDTLPALRALAAELLVRRERQQVREAIRRVELATEAGKSLPIPAAPGEHSGALPIPASGDAVCQSAVVENLRS